MGTNVHLTPELERFAKEVVDEGRYNNVSEVVRSALRLLQEQEERRKAFADMIAETRAEAKNPPSSRLDFLKPAFLLPLYHPQERENCRLDGVKKTWNIICYECCRDRFRFAGNRLSSNSP